MKIDKFSFGLIVIVAILLCVVLLASIGIDGVIQNTSFILIGTIIGFVLKDKSGKGG